MLSTLTARTLKRRNRKAKSPLESEQMFLEGSGREERLDQQDGCLCGDRALCTRLLAKAYGLTLSGLVNP